MKRLLAWTCLAAGTAIGLGGAGLVRSALAETPATAPAAVDNAKDPGAIAQPVLEKALAYLKSQQKPDSSWQNPGEPPGMSAIVLKAFMAARKLDGKLVYDADDTFLANGFEHLLSYQKPDGGIYDKGLEVYNTAISISAMAVSKEAEYLPKMEKAMVFLRSRQWRDTVEGVDKAMQVDPKDPNGGGWGYSQKGRGDLSNLQMALDALHDADVKPGDPAYKAALEFITRCQNLSETNDQPWAGDDGGFIYSAADPNSSAGGDFVGPNGQKMFRSYGSMTYAGLKSMIYAGLSKDDPRVKAAWNWIQKNYTLEMNPGIISKNPEDDKKGIYYYYHTMARALHAYGEPIITDAQGVRHDWRRELIAKLAEVQQPDGGMKIYNPKWMEDTPVLITAFAALSLEEAQADLREHPGK